MRKYSGIQFLQTKPEEIKDKRMIKGLRANYSYKWFFVSKIDGMFEIVCRKTLKTIDIVSKNDGNFN